MAVIQPDIAEEQDNLFTLTRQTCADCGQTFEASRRSPRCALCASLRTGQVGPAVVQCPACGLEHKVPVLAPHKLCACCLVDLEMTAGALRARLAAADAAYTDAVTRLDADLAHADERDQARYRAALAQEDTWGPERFGRNVAAAIARGDGLSPLLSSLLAMRAANDAAGVVAREVWAGLAEVERAQEEPR